MGAPAIPSIESKNYYGSTSNSKHRVQRTKGPKDQSTNNIESKDYYGITNNIESKDYYGSTNSTIESKDYYGSTNNIESKDYYGSTIWVASSTSRKNKQNGYC